MSESSDQIALFDLLSRLEGRYPLLQYVMHPRNESSGGNKVRRSYTKKDGSTGWKMIPVDVLNGAQMGVRPGAPDIFLPVRNRAPIQGFPPGHFTGLAIERKAAKGRASDDQTRWLVHLTSEGWYATVAREWGKEAALIITWVGGDPDEIKGLL